MGEPDVTASPGWPPNDAEATRQAIDALRAWRARVKPGPFDPALLARTGSRP